MRYIAVALFTFALIVALPVSVTAGSHVDSTPAWLLRLNDLRAVGHLKGVAEDTWRDRAAKFHARYMVLAGEGGHAEDRHSPYWSPLGSTAGMLSLVEWFPTDVSDRELVNAFAAMPFHSLSMFDPSLETVGFASYRDSARQIQSAGDLFLGRGWGDRAPPGGPTLWPGRGSTVSLTQIFPYEHPNPLSDCRDYPQNAGLPIIYARGIATPPVHLVSAKLKRDGLPVETCAFDAASYTGNDASETAWGRAILSLYNAVIIVPRDPLQYGSSYRVEVIVDSLTRDHQRTAWNFRCEPADEE